MNPATLKATGRSLQSPPLSAWRATGESIGRPRRVISLAPGSGNQTTPRTVLKVPFSSRLPVRVRIARAGKPYSMQRRNSVIVRRLLAAERRATVADIDRLAVEIGGAYSRLPAGLQAAVLTIGHSMSDLRKRCL